MLVKYAKEIARQWIAEHASEIPGFCGAYVHGSASWLPDDAVLPATSDLDVFAVLDSLALGEKPGKFRHRGVLLEVSYLGRERLRSPEQVLSDYHLAGGFRRPGILLDPTGQLTRLQAAVSRQFARRSWVRRRCEDARGNILSKLQSLRESDPFHDQVTAWLFGAGVTTHVLLVAGLANPTVRRRYLAARELLAEYGRLDFYEELLDLLGCAGMSRQRAEHHLDALAEAFDTAGAALKTPYRFAADLSRDARPVAIDGSRELVERGDHREAVFWMAATYSRCQAVLAQDAPIDVQSRIGQGYRDLLGDLGIAGFADLARRCAEVDAFLPRLWKVAQEILAANKQIEEDRDAGNAARAGGAAGKV